MDVTKHIICELTGYKPVTVDVSQGDRGSRAVSCRLLENGAPWMIPEGATARVAYTLPDGIDGLYDSRPDGTPMWEISKNIVTVELADQLMAQAGMVQMSILIIGPEGGQLATWPIRVMVCADNAARLTVPENLPPYGAGFAGKLFYGGADGTITPLGLGDGVRVEMMANGAMVLVGEGSGPSEDILTELRALADRVNAALNSDDATLDQLSEIVAYIKSNKTLIDAITTSKVSVADIVNNLTTNVANKPLSAAQGVVLKTLIDELRQTVGQGGGTGDGAVRSVNGKTGDVTLTATDVGAMSESGANAIIINLLDEAKKSGEFDGPPGDDYVLTDADRQEIAEIAAGLVEVPDSAETTRADELIASGITPTGAKGFVETGMTWRQLKEYREFVLMIASVGDNTNFPSSCSFRIRTATNFDYWGMPPLGRLDKSGAVVRVRFIDDEKTIYGISAVYDTAYQVKTSVAYSEESMLNYRSAGFFGPIHGGMGYVDLTANSAGAPDDSPVVLYFPAATTCEYEWKAIGVFR